MKEFEANNENDYLPLRDVVFNTLRTSILTGELKPGERLMEIHLADKPGHRSARRSASWSWRVSLR